jgi:hypothetical protein
MLMFLLLPLLMMMMSLQKLAKGAKLFGELCTIHNKKSQFHV